MASSLPGPRFPLEELARRIDLAGRRVPWVRYCGEVVAVTPSAIVVGGLSRQAQLGSLVSLSVGNDVALAEVMRLERGFATVKPLDGQINVALGSRAYPAGELQISPDHRWKGRLIDSLGRPVDGAGFLVQGDSLRNLHGDPPPAMNRSAMGGAIRTGVKVIDVFTPLCFGQRIGIFAGSGVGKSTLLSMLARSTGFDSIVVALVGERGREVRDFIETALGAMAKNTVTVVSTGDESPMMRRLAPLTATTIAEHFRDHGEQVLMIMDSVTRYAHACRDVALAAGEPPVARGYPPSVFSDLPRLLERAGPGQEGKGSITALYAVLIDGDDHNDPVADAIRGTLDGHVVLERAIAETGRYPAVNVLTSISRLAGRVWTAEQRQVAAELKKLVARFEDTRDLRAMGGYVAGADMELDRAIVAVPRLYDVLTQSLDNPPSIDPYREIAACLSA
ncbi:MAG: flagellar protein export ATPase FliI [Alphaproteobacteria bacterium]|nr:flagellar protein export ATPase FliI [Alphaproteobacteria bacterium]